MNVSGTRQDIQNRRDIRQSSSSRILQTGCGDMNCVKDSNGKIVIASDQKKLGMDKVRGETAE